MAYIKHGLSIGIERVEDEFFLSLKAVGKLTHADYEIITPLIDAALAWVKNTCQPHHKVRLKSLSTPLGSSIE